MRSASCGAVYQCAEVGLDGFHFAQDGAVGNRHAGSAASSTQNRQNAACGLKAAYPSMRRSRPREESPSSASSSKYATDGQWIRTEVPFFLGRQTRLE